jgi:hypothetical protein
MAHMRYLFSLGDSTEGSVGASLAVCAAGRASAIVKAQELARKYTDEDGGFTVVEGTNEYLRLYLNPDWFSIGNIEEEWECSCNLGS